MKKRNRKSFGRVINWQHLKDSKVSHDYGKGEASPYWEWVEKHSERSEDGDFREFPQANPDVLPDEDLYNDRRIELQELIRGAYDTLTLKETRVFNLLADENTEEEIAKKMGVSRSRVRNIRSTIKIKFDRYSDKTA